MGSIVRNVYSYEPYLFKSNIDAQRDFAAYPTDHIVEAIVPFQAQLR